VRLQIDEVPDGFVIANLTRTNKNSKKLRLYLPPDVAEHLGLEAKDLAAFRMGKTNGKPCCVITKAEIVV
jgi:hypothetical protein